MHTKFELASFNWSRDVATSLSGTVALSPFDREHMTSYFTLIETMHLSCTILEL